MGTLGQRQNLNDCPIFDKVIFLVRSSLLDGEKGIKVKW